MAKRVVAIIPARGGSKGIPRKNLHPVCGHPLIAWSIAHARSARRVDQVFVSSDSGEILEVAGRYGAVPIRRPAELAGDEATSESAWGHALEWIAAHDEPADIVVGMQATSPIRERGDLDAAVGMVETGGFDSVLSCCEVADFFLWKYADDGRPRGINHDFEHRQRRQKLSKTYLENGSFYVFTPDLLNSRGNRLGGNIGMHVMPLHTLFQIDELEDLRLCEVIMRGYGLDVMADHFP